MGGRAVPRPKPAYGRRGRLETGSRTALIDFSFLVVCSDAAVQHPLLQELVRRAPGTYNHSINVASIAETAADAISANGLLVRVGAYFHDIGKMLKPSYFVENQGPEGSRHV